MSKQKKIEEFADFALQAGVPRTLLQNNIYFSYLGSRQFGLQTSTSDVDLLIVYIPELVDLLRSRCERARRYTTQAEVLMKSPGAVECLCIPYAEYVQRLMRGDVQLIENLYNDNPFWPKDTPVSWVKTHLRKEVFISKMYGFAKSMDKMSCPGKDNEKYRKCLYSALRTGLSGLSIWEKGKVDIDIDLLRVVRGGDVEQGERALRNVATKLKQLVEETDVVPYSKEEELAVLEVVADAYGKEYTGCL